MAKSKADGLTTVPAVVSGKGELIDASSYQLLADPESFEAMQINLEGERLSEFDLDRIKVPAAGGTVWQVPTIDGVENQEAIEGVILAIQVRRGFWESPFGGGAAGPPDCSSMDGITGVGTPGGECATCPMNEFGSAVRQDGKQGRGKRCSEKRLMLVLRAGDRLPIAISAPATSIKGIKQFLMRLPVPMFQAVVSIGLEREKSGDGIHYSRIVLGYIGHIGSEQGKQLQAYAAKLKKTIVAQPMRREDDSQGGAADLPD